MTFAMRCSRALLPQDPPVVLLAELGDMGGALGAALLVEKYPQAHGEDGRSEEGGSA